MHEKARDSIDHHYSLFQDVVTLADAAVARKQYTSAAVYAQVAAHYAWLNHPGIFSSPRLEQILRTIGLNSIGHSTASAPRPPAHESPVHILHVMSEAYPIGGHTRLVWRWIQYDTERRHSVVLTNQGQFAVPQPLRDAPYLRGGSLITLDRRTCDILTRAKALRKIAMSADLIVLHIHPYDVIPIIAFADKVQLPCVMLLNHADHVFWIGASISDSVANTRNSGLRLSVERRGIPRDRCMLLPLPIVPSDRVLSKSEAKRHLGLGDEVPVLLSIASAYKYTPTDGLGFAEILASVLEEHQRAVLFVIGVSDQWADAVRRTQGRMRILKSRSDVDVFYQAADIFVDSFPLCSETALLEAASLGVVPVSYCAQSRESEVLCTDAPSLEPHVFRANGLAAYRALLSHLIEDAAYRSDLGEHVRRAVLDVHCGEAWLGALRKSYARAVSIAPLLMSQERTDGDQRAIGDLDILLDRVHTKSGVSRGIDETLQSHFRLLPLRARIHLWSKLIEKDLTRGWGLLLPSRLDKRVERRLRRLPHNFYVSSEQAEVTISRISTQERERVTPSPA